MPKLLHKGERKKTTYKKDCVFSMQMLDKTTQGGIMKITDACTYRMYHWKCNSYKHIIT